MIPFACAEHRLPARMMPYEGTAPGSARDLIPEADIRRIDKK